MNSGTKEEPIFSSDNMFKLKINDDIAKFQWCNILFTDLNHDNKKDLLYFSGTQKTQLKFYYSLNISSNDSIILGPSNNLIFNEKQIEMPDKQIPLYALSTAAGNKTHLAYFDTNNDGVKEFYVNSGSIIGWHRYYAEGDVSILNNDEVMSNAVNKIKLTENMLTFDSFEPNTELIIFNIIGKCLFSKKIHTAGRNEIVVPNLSPGAYFIQLKSSMRKDTFKFIKSK